MKAKKKGRKTPPKRPAGLTDKMQLFAREYLVDLNAAAAYVRAGYSPNGAHRAAARLMAKHGIRAAIDRGKAERAERTEVKADDVIRELARVGFSDMRAFAKWGPDGVVLKDSESLTAEQAACVSEVSQTTSDTGGSLRFKLHDKLAALDKLGRHLKLFTDKHELTGPDGGPVFPELAELLKLSHDELLRLHRESLGLPAPDRQRPEEAGGGVRPVPA